MIFKQLAVSVLNRVLGKYIKDLDVSNLELAILSGQAVLRNLELREDALNGFDLPVEVIQGYIGEISLTIPWTNLYTASCYICVEDVYLIAVPVKEKLYDAEKARASEVSVKRKGLRQIAENAKKSESSKDSADTSTEDANDSFVEKLVAQVVKNLKVSVKNIHFRYEDKVTCPEQPFACGFTLQNLSAETTSDDWEPIVIDSDTTTIYKLASLDNLSVYWNTKLSDSNLFSGRWNWKNFMEDGISTKENIPRSYEFILHPLSAECHIILDQSTEIEMDMPKLLVEVIQQELALTLSQKQFHNLMELLDSFELMMVNQKYKKFQPTVDIIGNTRSWWKYAYTAICEERIRSWSWSRIKEHRTRYRTYKDLYKKKLKGFYYGSEKERTMKHLQVIEDDLDIPSILIARQQAEIEVPLEKRHKKEIDEPSSQGGWWSWLGLETAHVEEPVTINNVDGSIMSKLTVAALPLEEKDKLYRAINYSESTAPVKYAVEYIKRRVTFNLDSCVLTLLDETKQKIAQISTVGLAAALEQRPGGNAIMFRFEVNYFQVDGTSSNESETPCLMSSQNQTWCSSSPLLSFSAETNPLELKADYSVKLKIEPIEVNYDNLTMDKVIEFFDVPNKSKLYEMEAAAANKLKELQSWTRAGLEYAITQHKVTYIAVDIRSPLVIVPEFGNIKSKGNLLIVDLGHLTIISDLVNRDNTLKLASDEELAKMFYDKFDVKITNVQMMIVDQDCDWRKTQQLEASPDHILPPTELELQAFKSISAEYPELPQFKTTAVIPKIWFKFSDTKCKELLKFLDHFPFGKATDPTKEAVDETEKIDKEWARTASTLSLEEANSIQVLCRDTFLSKTVVLEGKKEEDDDVWFDSVEHLPRRESSDSKALDLTQLVGEFLIHQLLVTIDKADSLTEKPYVCLEIKNLSARVTVSTWHIKVTTTLGFIELLDNHFRDADGLPLCVLTSKPKHEWITIIYIKADPKGPAFLTNFNNTEQFIKVVFTSIELTAKKEALASFQLFMLGLLKSVSSEAGPHINPKKHHPLETIEEDEPLEIRPLSPVPHSAKDISIEAKIEEVSINLIANEQNVGQINVSGLNVDIDVCGSETKIRTMLEDLSVLNAAERTLYPKILCLRGNTVFDCEITLFDNKRRPSDPLALDVSVDLRIGQFKFVYLSGFTAHIQNFVQALISPETVAYAQNLTQQVVKSQAQSFQESGSKIGLKIGVCAPTVQIPGHSFSKDMLVAVLGNLDITNSIGKSKDGVLMDYMDVSLNSLSVHCLSEGKKLSTDYLLEPIKLDISVKRTLQHTDLPLIEVGAVLPLVQLNIAVPDYKLIMTLINKNLSEGSQELEKSSIVNPQPLDSKSTISDEVMDGIRHRLGSVFEERTRAVSAHPAEDQISLKCNVSVSKVVLFSPIIVNNESKPYLVLTVEKLLSTITIDTWTISINSELGTLELLDCVNTGKANGQPVPIISSSKAKDLISLEYKMVDPACPDFESTHCSVEQRVDFNFRRLNISCSQKSTICLQEHVLAMTASDVAPSSEIIRDTSSNLSAPKKTPSFKLSAIICDVDVLLTMDDKPLTNVSFKGLAVDILMWDGGIVIKSTQRGLSVLDLNSETYYPEIVSVQNENVFDFEYKSLNSEEYDRAGPDDESLDPDSSLVMNIGRIKVVFLYKFIDALMHYVEPLTSPQSTKYVQETAQKSVYSQIESIQTEGSRISLSIAINAPLVIVPCHSTSVDMFIADLGHLELQNEFQVFELDLSREKVIFDSMELSLQSVQLARGKIDLSNSSVVKRYLIEPVKMDANIRRSLKSSCHEFPLIDAHCTLDYIKMNLASKDYMLLTTIMHENLNEGQNQTSQENIAVDAAGIDQEGTEIAHDEDYSEDNISIESTSSKDAYEYLEFTFDLPGVSLTLYKNEKDLDPFDSQSPVYEPHTKLCLTELEETTIHIAIPSDNSVHIRGILHGLVVEDARPDTSSEFPRLVDKKIQRYSEASMSSAEEMFEFIYRQQTNGDMDILFQLQHATIFVNFPFIWPLLEFFTTPASVVAKKDVFVTPAESQTSLDGFPDDRDAIEPHSEQLPALAPGETVPLQYKITVRGTIKDPNIVLLANPQSKESEALILNTELEFQYTMHNEDQKLLSNIHNLQIVSCQYPNVKQTSFLVLEPCDLTLKYKTPFQDHKGQGINVDVDTMRLRFSPFLYKILNDVLLSVTGQEKVTEGMQTEGNNIISPPDDFWDPKPITADSWNKASAETTEQKTIVRQSTGDKIVLNTKEIQLVVVNEVHGAQVPFVMINTKVKANAVDYTAQMKLEADLSVEISYYNEHLNAWEPLVEPIEEDRNNPLWELQVKIFFADGYISSFTPRDQESMDGPPQDLTDGPDAHRWIPWQSRPRSESKKKLTSKRSSTGKEKMKVFKKSKRHARREGVAQDEEDLDFNGALEQFVLSSTKLVGEVSEDVVNGVTCPSDDGFSQIEPKPQATYVVINSHDNIQLTVSPTALDVLSHINEAFTSTTEHVMRSVPGPVFSISNKLGVHCTVTVENGEKICDMQNEVLTIKHREPKLERDMSLSHMFANYAASLIAEQRKKKNKKKLFSEPLLGHFRQKFLKIQRRRAMSLPVALEGKTSKVKRKTLFQIGGSSVPTKPKLRKTVSCGVQKVTSAASDKQSSFSMTKSLEETNIGDQEEEHGHAWRTRLRNRKNELFALVKHDEEDEADFVDSDQDVSSTRDCQKDVDSSTQICLGSVESKLAMAIGNIGTFCGGLSSPTFSEDEVEQPEDTCEDSVDGSRAEEVETYISFEVDGYYEVDYVPILRSGSYLYKLEPRIGDEFNVNTLVVVQIDTKNGQKTVTIHSPLQVYNHLCLSVDVLTYDDSKIGAKNPFIHLLTVEPDSLTNIPMTVAYGKDLYLRPCHPRCVVSQEPLSWRNFSKEDIVLVFPQVPLVESAEIEHQVKLLDSNKPLQIKAHFHVDSLKKTPSKDVPHHVIHLHPPITLHNLLPINISRLSMVIDSESQGEEVIQPGEKVTIMTESVEHSCQLKMKLNDYEEEDWFGTLTIDNTTGKTTELRVTNSTDQSNNLVLGVLIMRSGTTDVTIYSPYWLINKSQLPIEYRVSKTHQMFYQTAAEDQALLFSFPPKSNRKVRMRVNDASWSSHISLDVIGDSGFVSCYNSKMARKFEFVLQIVMSQTGLTKIVTLTPKYVLINKAEFSLSICEDDVAATLWHAIEPSEVKPFWPISATKQLLAKPTLSSFVSKAFPYNYSHTSVLRMVEPKAICVEVNGDLEGSVTTILFTPYTPGVGTIRIENLCDNVTLRFLQEKTCHVTVLQPQFSILYTWDDPTKRRKLYWKPYLGMDDAIEVPIHKDDYGKVQLEISEEGPDVKVDRKLLEDSNISCVNCTPSCIPSSRYLPSDTDESGFDEVDDVAMLRRRSSKRYKKTIYWVSVLDALQRVLLFTEDGKLASKARKSSECEAVRFELFVSLDGVGLSLMNSRPEEVVNITLSSSTSVWQVEKTPGHWKTLGIELSAWLEDAWKNGQEQLNMDSTATVDFSRMEMIAPYEGSLRRSFEPGLWFHYCSSQHYQSVHSKMHRIQIDNQLYGTVFPVALYPAPLPVGVALRNGPKPFIEMSVIYHQVPGQGVHHFKYAKVLIQEMNVKLDKSFIVTLTSLFSKPPELYDEEVQFKLDTESYQVQLNETMAVKAALQTKRVFLEYFHLSPLKINLSFSLLSDVDEDDDQAFAADIMDFFVDSIGATLVDMNDAQLKLAYFERVGVFITQENLQSQITTHYTMQGVRQFYALVLGLDVLGNPYALISGIGEGVRDLFYEPYQGIIYGPQEFAQGLARGVKSLLGHVVGGTAGAFSRITGTIGQAVATLSFDTDYRLKRRQRMYIEPSGIGQGLMMGGKSLVMGLVFGIGGIVMKPIEGARTEGVEGFFKGIGKGLLGLLARPTGGVIDMVSFTLDGIRRSAEQGGEDIAHRMRLPRFAAPNEPLKPYSKQEATGFGILKGLPRALELSRDVYESHFLVSEDGNLVLLTNKRIIMLNQSRFWREWKVDWMCSYEEVKSTPFIAVNSLVIKYQKSSDDDITTNVYEIQCDDPDRLKDLRVKIIGLLRRFK